MNIEKQVCTLQQARILKELGAPQDGLFAWVRPLCKNDFVVEFGNAEQLQIKEKLEGDMIRNQLPTVKDREFFCAYTGIELGVMLGEHINCIKEKTLRYRHKYKAEAVSIAFDTEAQARASLLIYLMRNNVISSTGATHLFRRK